MQIMVEGLALGAFGTLYQQTKEPLLKELLEMRHPGRGAPRPLRRAARCASTSRSTSRERERREREDWAFEVALLMRNRFIAYEVYEEWFEGRMTARRMARRREPTRRA